MHDYTGITYGGWTSWGDRHGGRIRASVNLMGLCVGDATRVVPRSTRLELVALDHLRLDDAGV